MYTQLQKTVIWKGESDSNTDSDGALQSGIQTPPIPQTLYFFHARFGIGASIYIVREIRCLPYAGFFSISEHFTWSQLKEKIPEP